MKTETTKNYFAAELQEFSAVLATEGVGGALRYLNQRTPHRYTGIYQYDGDTLRNIALYDNYDPNLQKGDDAPLAATYCSLLIKNNALEIVSATDDQKEKDVIDTPVVSYCGVLMRDADGNPFGSLCHFDYNRCQERITDFPLLEAAAKLLYTYLYPNPSKVR